VLALRSFGGSVWKGPSNILIFNCHMQTRVWLLVEQHSVSYGGGGSYIKDCPSATGVVDETPNFKSLGFEQKWLSTLDESWIGPDFWYILSSGHFNGNIHGQVYRLFLTHGKGEYSKTNHSTKTGWSMIWFFFRFWISAIQKSVFLINCCWGLRDAMYRIPASSILLNASEHSTWILTTLYR
jgi:hypothetical protein